MAIPQFLQPEVLPYASVEIVQADGTVDSSPLVHDGGGARRAGPAVPRPRESFAVWNVRGEV
jgi:hypothetical protein